MKKVDFTNFSPTGELSNDLVFQRRWWAGSPKDRPQAVASVLKFLIQVDSQRQTQYNLSARLYGNTSMIGVNGFSFSKQSAVQNALKDRVSYNVVQSATDTIVAKMSKNKPKPLFLTSGGDYKLQRKAKKLDEYIDGIFYENDAYSLGNLAFRDACVLGDGLVHVYADQGRTRYERAYASELYVDWLEAYYGNPRQLHWMKNVDRDALIEMFPSKKKAIMEANSASADFIGNMQNIADQVTVFESWKLPSGPEAKDGLHSINLVNENLLDEVWDKPFFPFAKMPWCHKMYGFWSQGLPEQIQNIQLEINKILWVIQRSIHLAGSFKVFVKNGSKVVKEHLNNDIGAIITYNDVPPQYVTPPVVPLEFYNHLNTLKIAAFEQAGVSMLSAAAQKPAGLDSGKALREYNDIESDRFMTIGHQYEKFYLDLARISIATTRDIFTEEKKLTVQVPGKRFLKEIDWKEIDLEDDEYIMKMFPVSSLPSEPAGRLQTIQEYMQAGIISPRTGRKLLQFPDLEQVEDLMSAQEDWLHDILEEIVDEGIPGQLEPGYDDMDLAKELALEYYMQGKLNNLDEEKLDLLRQFMDQIHQAEQMAQAAMQPPPAQIGNSGAGNPQAVPEAPPQSALIPNVVGAA